MSKATSTTAQKKIVLPLNQFKEAMLKAATLSKESLVQALWEPRYSLLRTLFGLIQTDNNNRKAVSKAGKGMPAKLAEVAKSASPEETQNPEQFSNLAKSKSKLSALMAHPEMAYGLLLPIAHVRTHLLMVGCYANLKNPEFPYLNVNISDRNPPKLWLIPTEYAQLGILSQSPVEFIFDSSPQAFRGGSIPGEPMRQTLKKINLHNVPDGKYKLTLEMLQTWEIVAPSFSLALCTIDFNEVYREHTFFACRTEPAKGKELPQSKVKVVLMPSLIEVLGLAINLTHEEVELADKPDWDMTVFDTHIGQFFNQLSGSLDSLGRMYYFSRDEFRHYQGKKTRHMKPLNTQGVFPAAERLTNVWQTELNKLGLDLSHLMPMPNRLQMKSLSLTWPFALSVDAIHSIHTGLKHLEIGKSDSDPSETFPKFKLDSMDYAVGMDSTWTIGRCTDDHQCADTLMHDEPFVLALTLGSKEEALDLAQRIEEIEGAPNLERVRMVNTSTPETLAEFCLPNAIAMHRLLSASLMDFSPPKSMPERELGDVFWMY